MSAYSTMFRGERLNFLDTHWQISEQSHKLGASYGRKARDKYKTWHNDVYNG